MILVDHHQHRNRNLEDLWHWSLIPRLGPIGLIQPRYRLETGPRTQPQFLGGTQIFFWCNPRLFLLSILTSLSEESLLSSKLDGREKKNIGGDTLLLHTYIHLTYVWKVLLMDKKWSMQKAFKKYYNLAPWKLNYLIHNAKVRYFQIPLLNDNRCFFWWIILNFEGFSDTLLSYDN